VKENYLTKAKAVQIKNEMSGLFKHPRLDFDCRKAALLVLDMQEFFVDSASHAYIPSMECIIPNISALIKRFENVMFTKHVNTDENAGMMAVWWRDIVENDRIISEFDTKGHVVIEKSQYDAFYNTELNGILKDRGVDTLVITGVMTHLCCETTARSAFMRGYNTFFVVDATATYNEEFHRSSVLNLSHGFAVPVLTGELLVSLPQ